MRAEVYGYSSASGWIEQYSVNTTPQPPSALVPRKAAFAPGRSDPGPAQCAVWKKRLRAVLDPIFTLSKRMSYLESRAIAGSLLMVCGLTHRLVYFVQTAEGRLFRTMVAISTPSSSAALRLLPVRRMAS